METLNPSGGSLIINDRESDFNSTKYSFETLGGGFENQNYQESNFQKKN